MDLPLFIRKHNALELTPEGDRLFQAISAGLDTISAAVAVLTGKEESGTITITATDGTAQFWLRPLIDSWAPRHEGVSFVVLASDADDSMRLYADVDLSILCGNHRCEVGEELHFLFQESAQPVCSPAYLQAHGPFDDADALSRADLLDLHERHWNADAIGWQPLGRAEWFRAQGIEWKKPTACLSSNKVNLLMQEALSGRGIMLGWRHMVAADIDAGRLVYAHPASLSVGRGNFLNCKKKSLARPMVAAFVAHLLAEAGQSI